ncbi:MULTISPECIES: hypothetical protein [unclassified Sphingomonas]|uniref:hypothetical protein n=1 Tax=unclassified Sphingomonas TaxID=196159 RepID=UPI00226BA011|nr:MULTISPECIES: hypothetical protein [unclassified Sphingomonas]
MYAWLEIVLGVIMTVLSAVIYPTFMHQMQSEWVEWTRLMELPFVACELVIIHIAIRVGYRDRFVWAELPRDVVVALGLLLVGLTVSSVFVSKNPSASITCRSRPCSICWQLERPAGRGRGQRCWPWLSLRWLS